MIVGLYIKDSVRISRQISVNIELTSKIESAQSVINKLSFFTTLNVSQSSIVSLSQVAPATCIAQYGMITKGE